MVEDLLSIEEITKDKLFKIPDYQRGFSWEKEQLDDLVKDIEHITNKGHKHYTGTIVITKNGDRYDVVDGQQRLTTLIILLNVIYQNQPDKFPGIKSKFLIRKDEYVLQTNAETWNFFKEAIIGSKRNLTTEIKSLTNLKFAKEYFQKWISQNSSDIESIYDTVIHKLGFLCFSPKNTDEIGIMFEVINNRGKSLSELEKIKNYFIYYSTIHNRKLLKDRINDNWGTILKYLNLADVTSNDDENRFLRNCYIVYHSSDKKKSWYVYDELKEKYPPDTRENLDEKFKEIEGFIDFIINAAQSYAFFYNKWIFAQEHPEKSKITMLLKKLRCHPVNASIFPIYLAIMYYVQDKSEQVAKLLDILEKLNFRVYVLPNTKIARADSKQGELFWWAHSFYWDDEWHTDDEEEDIITTYGNKKIDGDHCEWLKMELIEFTKHHCPEETIIQSLTTDDDESIDYYHWNGLRFFLASFEAQLNAERKESWDIEKILIKRGDTEQDRGNDHLSREHIWASENRAHDFPSDIREKRRLGNFVLIGLRSNIQLSNDDIDHKVEFLIDNDLNSMLQVTRLKKYLEEAIKFSKSQRTRRTKYYYSDIAAHLIDHRETDLIQFALERWKLPNERMNRFDKVDSFKAWSEGRNRNYYLHSKS